MKGLIMKKKTLLSLLLAAAVLTSCGCKSNTEYGYHAEDDDDDYDDERDSDVSSNSDVYDSSAGDSADSLMEEILGGKELEGGVSYEEAVTSANSTAASIRQTINSFLTIADCDGYGMRSGDENADILYISASRTDDGVVWTCTPANPDHFNSNDKITWGHSGSAMADMSKDWISDSESLLCLDFANRFPSIERISIYASLVGGKCVGVISTEDTSDPLVYGTDCPSFGDDGSLPYTFAWDGHTAGVSSSGMIVGTAPFVQLED